MRSSDDLTYVRNGLMDEVVVNANQLENSIQSTAACLWKTNLPFSIDPVLWRFQVPAWSRNAKGDTKRNYQRLGQRYSRGTDLTLGSVPLLDVVSTDAQWKALAANVIAYQAERLSNVPTQLELLADLRELHPARLMAPALMAFSTTEDRLNRLMVESAAASADGPIAVQIIIPFERLIDGRELRKVVSSIPTGGVSSYFIWTPKVTEERLIADNELLVSLRRLIATLAGRGIPVGYQYANYSIFALHDGGLAAATHHLGWVDHGEPSEEQAFMIRSCQTYVPAIRHCVRFPEASTLGGPLSADEYSKRYCECDFCAGAFNSGGHPLTWLLESQTIVMKNGRERLTPTSQAVGANTWHYLLSRRLEVQAFSADSASDVIERDIERASALNRGGDASRLEHLATELKSA
ncbi:MAG: hypothetical protein ACYCST_16015 [Acidimicrobiales bacterium]